MDAVGSPFADWLEGELGISCAEAIARAEALRSFAGDPEAVARRRLSKLSADDAVADGCPGCGGHAEENPLARVRLFVLGGVARCKRCGVEVRVEPLAVPEDTGLETYELFSAERWVWRGEEKKTEPKFGRFRVLPRTDGRFVVHDDEADRIRFGPVFSTDLEARWRIWWRVKGEEKTGVRLDAECLVHGIPATLLEFFDDRRAAVRYPVTGEVAWAAVSAIKPIPVVVHVLEAGLALCRFVWDEPGEWPMGHRWVTREEAAGVTCRACREVLP